MAARTPHLVDDEHEVARRVAAWDADGARRLYARWAGPVLTLATRWLGDRQLAEDVVQETFVKAWRGSERFDPQRDLGPWLYTIARRVAIDVGRRERRRPVTTPLRASTPAPEGPTFEQSWETWQVRRVVQGLSESDRELIHLTHVVGLSQSQIARRLGIPVGTVKSRTSRVHRHLADRLSHLREAPRPTVRPVDTLPRRTA